MPQIIELNNHSYYNSIDIIKENNDVFKHIIDKPRSIIQEMKLGDADYIFAYYNIQNKWGVSSQPYTRAKVLILTHIVQEYLKSKPSHDFANLIYKFVPPNKYYFSVVSIMTCFKISIPDVSEDKQYVADIHYVYLTENESKTLYFTFTGMTKLLYSLQHPLADKFHEWICNMKTEEKKHELSITGITTYSKVLMEIPSCIYILILGNVKSLRKSMAIDLKYDDEQLVCKYGLTNNYVKRFGQHKREFEKLEGCILNVYSICTVDKTYLHEVETHVKQYVKTLHVDYYFNTHTEFMIVNKDVLDNQIKKELKILYTIYNHKVSESRNVVEKLHHQMDMLELTHKYEISNKDRIFAERELEFYKKYYFIGDL